MRAVVVALILLAIREAMRFPWRDTGSALRQANLWLLLIAVAMNLTALVARGWSWHLLLKPAGSRRWWNVEQATLLGAAIGTVSIAVAGEGTRVRFVVRRDRVDGPLALAALVWSRVVEGLALIPLLAIAPFVLDLPPIFRTLYVSLGITLAVVLTLVLLRRWLPLTRFLPGFARRGISILTRIPGEGTRLGFPLVFGLVHWLAQLVTYHYTFLAVGIAAGWGAAFIALVLSNVAWTVRFTPGNVGLMQGSIAVALLPFGVPAVVAVLAGLVLQAVQALPIVILAAAITGGRHFVELVRQESVEP